MANELKNSKELMPSVANKKTVDKKLIPDLLDGDKLSLSEDDVDISPIFDLEDGVAQTPGGAILSLTLGMLDTFYKMSLRNFLEFTSAFEPLKQSHTRKSTETEIIN